MQDSNLSREVVSLAERDSLIPISYNTGMQQFDSDSKYIIFIRK